VIYYTTHIVLHLYYIIRALRFSAQRAIDCIASSAYRLINFISNGRILIELCHVIIFINLRTAHTAVRWNGKKKNLIGRAMIVTTIYVALYDMDIIVYIYNGCITCIIVAGIYIVHIEPYNCRSPRAKASKIKYTYFAGLRRPTESFFRPTRRHNTCIISYKWKRNELKRYIHIHNIITNRLGRRLRCGYNAIITI